MLTTIIDRAKDRRDSLLEEAAKVHLAQSAAGARRTRWHGTRQSTQAGSLRPAAVAATGLFLVGLSAGTVTAMLQPDETRRGTDQTATIARSGRAEVTLADLVYEAGHSSGWHIHPGLHAVVVLSGTLTVYDQACGRRDYGPGETYVGGREPHVARSEHGEPIRMVAMYVADGAVDQPGSAVPAPGGCEEVA